MACRRVVQRWLQVTAALLLIAKTSGVGQTSLENTLFDDLFDKYNPVVRPVLDPSNPVHVTVSYAIRSLGDVNEKGQTVSVHGFLQLTWKDEFLTWNPTDYANVDSIFVPVDRLWTPDLMFENGVGEQFFKKEHFRTRVHDDGRVQWEVGGQMELICDFTMRNYPFDVQQCAMQLVTWAGTDDHITIVGDFFDTTTFYIEQSNWQIFNARTVNYSFTENGESFSEVHFRFGLRRKSLSNVLGVIIPVVLFSILNGVVFLLPAESEEKISTSLTVLLSFTVLQLTIDSSIPSQSDSPPLLDIYITLFLVCSCVVVVLTVFSVRLHCQHQPITESAKKFLLIYNRMAEFIRRPTAKQNAIDVASPATMGRTISDDFTWSKVSYAYDRLCCIAYYLFFFVSTTVTLIKLIHF